MPTDDQKLNYDLVHQHPNGTETQDDVFDAVISALREVFNKGLNPLATKVALTTLAARCKEILDDEEAQSELTT
jgi:hypothetical protein